MSDFSSYPYFFQNLTVFFYLQKCQLKFGCKVNIKRYIMSKRKCTLGKIRFWKKINQNSCEKIVKIMGCPIFVKLPTPLVLFCPILLDPSTPQKSDIIYLCSLRIKIMEYYNQEWQTDLLTIQTDSVFHFVPFNCRRPQQQQ